MLKIPLVPLFLSLLLLCGCSTAGNGADPEAVSGPAPPSDAQALRIVSGAGTDQLLLAGSSANDVYTLAADSCPIYLDGAPADTSVLENGMPVAVTYSSILETWPGQLAEVSRLDAFSYGSERNLSGGFYDLCGLYVQVLEDLWSRDAALNDGITAISVDLSAAPGNLTDGEKAAIVHLFTSRHGDSLSAYSYTYEELAEQGFLSGTDPAAGEMPQWRDGLLFTISAAPQADSQTTSLPSLSFQAVKWRSALGAYGFSGCTAVWPEAGPWTDYTIGGEFIS